MGHLGKRTFGSEACVIGTPDLNYDRLQLGSVCKRRQVI